MDLIDRAEAIDACEKNLVMEVSLPDGLYNQGVRNCINRLKGLPPAQPEQSWIPCSERLPEECGTYICTCYDGTAIRVSFFKYQKRMKSWEQTGARAYWRVIAWMPLPEPYKGK